MPLSLRIFIINSMLFVSYHYFIVISISLFGVWEVIFVIQYIVVEESDENVRDCHLIRLLDSLPQVHYLTLRRIIAHLCEVTANFAINKATIENVAKVF